MADPVLKVTGLVAGYTPEVDILNGVEIDVNPNEIVTASNDASANGNASALPGAKLPCPSTV